MVNSIEVSITINNMLSTLRDSIESYGSDYTYKGTIVIYFNVIINNMRGKPNNFKLTMDN